MKHWMIVSLAISVVILAFCAGYIISDMRNEHEASLAAQAAEKEAEQEEAEEEFQQAQKEWKKVPLGELFVLLPKDVTADKVSGLNITTAKMEVKGVSEGLVINERNKPETPIWIANNTGTPRTVVIKRDVVRKGAKMSVLEHTINIAPHRAGKIMLKGTEEKWIELMPIKG